MTSSLKEAFLSHRGRTSGILGAISASLGASWGHLGRTWGHLGIPSAVWEIWLHALRLATLSALPVPMLRQVYQKRRFRSGRVQKMFFRGSQMAFSLGTSSKNGRWRCQLHLLIASWHLEAILGHLGPSWDLVVLALVV